MTAAVLRERLWKGFVSPPTYNIDEYACEAAIVESKEDQNVQSTILSMKKSLKSIENYLSERLAP